MSRKAQQNRFSTSSAPREDHARRERSASEDLFDQADVPAAVVCAFCGDAECPGCQSAFNQSGIVAKIAWERSATGWWNRLWATTHATTREAEYFFAVLPEGPLGAAFRFALLSELFALTSFLFILAPVAVTVAPGWLHRLAEDEQTRAMVFRIVALGVPALSLFMIGIHAVHGLALNHGAKRVGASPATQLALRFAFYAAGWDLMTSPIGWLVFAYREGPPAAIASALQIASLPRRSAHAFLMGAYRLDGDRAKVLMRWASKVTLVVTVVGALIFISTVAITALS